MSCVQTLKSLLNKSVVSKAQKNPACVSKGTATVARIPSMVTTTYGSSRDSLHHSLMRPQTLANSQMASNSCGSLLTSNKNQQGGLGNGNGNGNQNCSIVNNCSLNSTLIPNKGSEFYC